MTHPLLRFALGLAALVATTFPAGAQLVATARTASEWRLRYLPTPGRNLPTPVQDEVSVPPGSAPGTLAVYGAHSALVADLGADRILVVDLATASTVDVIPVPGFNGEGTIAVSPDRRFALAASGAPPNPTTLHVIAAPFGASSQISTLVLPGVLGDWVSQGIVFDREGRAFAYHRNGVSVLEPPYAAIDFTIPLTDNGSPGGGAIAISPDDQVLLLSKMTTALHYVGIIRAPFSADSTQEILPIPNPRRLHGIAIAPDNSFAMVGSHTDPELYVISAPFTSSSTVEKIPMPAQIATTAGFKHISISPDSKLAVMSGASMPPNDPYVIVEPPFTAAGATVHLVWPAGDLDRGSNPAIFLPGPLFDDGFESGDTGAWTATVP